MFSDKNVRSKTARSKNGPQSQISSSQISRSRIGRTLIILLQIFLLCIGLLNPLAALPPGLAAMGDDFQALRYNPAALSQGAATGVALGVDYTRLSDESFGLTSVDLFLNSDVYAHNFHLDLSSGILRQRLGVALPIGDFFSLGAAAEFEGMMFEEMDIAASFLLRPIPYLSIGAQGGFESFQDPYIDFSLALRPFTEHVTLGIGSRFDGQIYLPQLLAVIEPVNGIRIDGGYNFHDNSWHVGLSISASILRIGSDVKVRDTFNGGSSYLHLSPNSFDSIITEPPARFVEYKIGRVVDQRRIASGTILASLLASLDSSQELLKTLHEIRALCADPAVTGIVFKESNIQTTLTNYEELRQAFSQCKEEEKSIIFYASSYGNMGYAFAASIADEIYLHRGGRIGLVGYAFILPYVKDFLDELGVEVRVYQSHPGKTVGDTFARQSMSQNAREQYELLLDDYYQLLTEMLSERDLALPTREVIDGGPYLNSEYALEIGLVDGLMYEDEFDTYLKEEYQLPIPRQGGNRVPRAWPDATLTDVALIYAAGRINDGLSIRGLQVGDESIIPAIERAAAADSIAAIVLRIDSPGGSAMASDNIARALAKAAEKKPLLVWMGSAAASGGYFIASPGDSIIASPVTLTGSIGVLAQAPNLKGLSDNLGITWDGVKGSPSADSAGLGGLFRYPTAEEEERVQEMVDGFYEAFVNDVAAYRGADPSDIDDVAQGRVWSGSTALELGLVDKLGGYTVLMEELQNRIGSERIRLIPFEHGDRDLIGEFLFLLTNAALPGLDLTELGAVEELLKHEIQMLYLMPWTVDPQK